MNFALYHQAEGGTSFWAESYTGAQAVQVIKGHFQVLLGSRTPLNPADLVGDLYLGITVNGEEMLPREPIVASTLTRLIVSGGGTSMIEGDLQVGDNAWIPGFAAMDGNDMAVRGQFEQAGSGGARVYKLGIGTDPASAEGTLKMGGNLDMNTYEIVNTQGITHQGNIIQPAGGSSPAIRLISRNGVLIFIDSDNDATSNSFRIYRDDGYVGGAAREIFQISENGEITAHGQLDMNGNSVVNCGALTEANLQTTEELNAERIDRFEEGDVLCWTSGRLEKCSKANDRLVQAVADKDGRPIIIGDEAIKVLGPAQAGDTLVASDVPGYAVVNNNPRPGSVIAQALEDFAGERGLVKAMIRKF